MDALAHWTAQLEALAVPQAILDAAPESPWGFDVRRAREALPEGGAVIDVGCGAGAASLPLADRAGLLVGVDSSPAMLEAFAAGAASLGAAHRVHRGRWPDVAGEVAAADVAVCAHVLYNAPDLGAFVTALTGHARRRVVVELTETHPLRWTAPYWLRFHRLRRPDGPILDDALAALDRLGIAAHVERFTEPAPWHDPVPLLRRRLCLPADRDPEIAAAVAELGVPATRRLATLWWDVERTHRPVPGAA